MYFSVCESILIFGETFIINVDYNFSMIEELVALFSRDQKILLTCSEMKIFTGDQLAFVSWLLQFWQYHSVTYVMENLTNHIQRS